MRVQSYLAVVMVIAFSLPSHAAGPEAVKTAVAVRTNLCPEIDGLLDDPCWEKAIPSSDFIQMDPDEGQPATQQTIVRILYDEDNLYFGMECLDSEPEEIAATIVPRDAPWWPDDLIGIVLDTYYDRQNGYGFYTNPRGVQLDLRISADGASQDLSWDGIWQSGGCITNRGWTVEVAIPFKTLRFPRSQRQLWGLNIKRWRKTGSEDSFWSFISRDDLTELKVSRAGQLVGLEEIEPGLHVECLPYGVTRYDHSVERRDWRRDIGLDVKYGIASNLTADVTLNPDFAHIEADESQINLTRFELYLWEKRPFFLEGKELFSPMDLFYSRRIADPLFGAKVTGKIGRTNLSLLTAQDREEGPDPFYGVVRIQRDILNNSAVGFIAAAKQKTQEAWNRALGFDLGLRLGNNALTLNLARSSNPGIKKEDWQAGLHLSHFTDRFSIYGNLWDTQPEFNVDQTGFAPHDPHVGEKGFGGGVDYHFYVNRFGIWRVNLSQEAWASQRTDDPKWEWEWKNFDVYTKQRNDNALAFGHWDWYFRWMGKGYRGQMYEGGLLKELEVKHKP